MNLVRYSKGPLLLFQTHAILTVTLTRIADLRNSRPSE